LLKIIRVRMKRSLLIALLLLGLAGCSSVPQAPKGRITADIFQYEREASPAGREVAMHALMLLRTGYRFGGKNPEAGLDCSGMVTYVYQQAADVPLPGNAASLARQGREAALEELKAGDLVFFNTLGRPFSHVGIYLGKGEFIHAPNSRGSVRVDKLTNRYWSERFETARTLVN
jgi:cell wall-associated NlpC family hydrolase